MLRRPHEFKIRCLEVRTVPDCTITAACLLHILIRLVIWEQPWLHNCL